MDTQQAPPPAAPRTISVGSVEVAIYSRTRTVAGRQYPEFTISFYDAAGKRVRRSFASLDLARKEAKRVAAALSKGQNTSANLKSEDISHLQWALGALKPTGMSIPAALTEWSEWRAKVPAGFTMNDVLGDFVRRHPVGLADRTVEQVVEEFVADVERRQCSEIYAETIKKLGRQFSDAFRCPLSAVTPDIFKEWLWKVKKRNGKAPSGRTLQNYQRAFVLLVNFAARRKYVSRELAAEFAELESPKAAPPKCEVFSVDAFQKMLNAAGPETLAGLVMAGLAGVRVAEVQRLTWADIDLGERVVKIGASVAKTGSRRVVPLCESACEWLARVPLKSGPVLRVEPREMRMVGVRANVRWIANGLRHSFVSARLAVTHDASKTAYEAGNSPRMCQLHYRSLMTEAEGKKWFAVAPPQAANVIQFKQQREGAA